MKHATIVIVSLLCVGGLIGFWVMKSKAPPEVIKIYKVTPYEPRQEHAKQQETPTPPIEGIGASKREQTKSPQTDIVREPERLPEHELSPEEEAAFLDWLATLDTLSSTETITEKAEVVNAQNMDTNTEISYAELFRMVRETYDLKEVINSYFDPTDGYCPKCDQQDFEIMRNAKNGRLEAWCCFNCYNGAYDVSGFVAWIEGIDVTEAVRRLATQAGILE